jgi:cAMP phosphodiesterase
MAKYDLETLHLSPNGDYDKNLGAAFILHLLKLMYLILDSTASIQNTMKQFQKFRKCGTIN